MKTLEKKFFGSRAGMTLCLSGQAQILVNGVPFLVTRGVFRFISPVLHVVEIERSADYSESVVTEDMSIFYNEMRPIFGTFVRLRLPDHPCLQLDEEKIGFFMEQKRRIDAKRAELESTENEDEKMLVRRILHLIELETLIEFIHTYYRKRYVEPQPVERSEALVFDFLYALNMTMGRQRRVADYAAEAHLSQSHFSRIVKARTGKSPSEWIAIVAVLNAKALLGQTEMSIKQVAEALCFPEQFTFRKFFRHHTGLSPTAFRKQSRNTPATALAADSLQHDFGAPEGI